MHITGSRVAARRQGHRCLLPPPATAAAMQPGCRRSPRCTGWCHQGRTAGRPCLPSGRTAAAQRRPGKPPPRARRRWQSGRSAGMSQVPCQRLLFCRRLAPLQAHRRSREVQVQVAAPLGAPAHLYRAGAKHPCGGAGQQAAVGGQRHACRPSGVVVPAVQRAQADPVLRAPGLLGGTQVQGAGGSGGLTGGPGGWQG